MHTEEVRVWDRFVRCFHWSLAALFVVSYLSGEESDTLHAWSGYGVATLVLLRLIWGLVGSRHARFADFVTTPAAAVAYLRGLLRGDAPRWLGHNPAGGWMMLALLASLLMTTISGVVHYGQQGHGPLAAALSQPTAAARPVSDPDHDRESDDDDDESDEHDDGFWYEAHELLAKLTLALVLVHIAGVVASSLAHRENLVRAMWTGRKRPL